MINIIANLTIGMLITHLAFYLASAYYIYKTTGKSLTQGLLIKMTFSAIFAIFYWYVMTKPSFPAYIRSIIPTSLCISMVFSYNAHTSLFDNRKLPLYKEPLLIQTFLVSIACLIIGIFKYPHSFIIDVEGNLPQWDINSTTTVAYYVQNCIYSIWLIYLAFRLANMFYRRISITIDTTVRLRLIGAIIAWVFSGFAVISITIDIITAILIGSEYHDTINFISLSLIAVTPIAFMTNVIPQNILMILAKPIDRIADLRVEDENKNLDELNTILTKITPNVLRVSGVKKFTPMIEINDARDLLWTHIPRLNDKIEPNVEATFILYWAQNNISIQSYGPFPVLHPDCATKNHVLRISKLVSQYSTKTSPASSSMNTPERG